MGQPNPPAEGATPPADPTTPPGTPPAEPATGDGLGEAGKKLLAEMRAENKDLQKQVKALQDRDPLKDLLAKLGGQPIEPGTDPVAALTERVTKAEERADKAELAGLLRDVADAKGLTKAQAAELVGTTQEQLEAHADRLLAAFPAAPATGGSTPPTPGTPAPDPSQGSRGGGADLHAAIKAAQDKGDVMEAIRLKGRLLEDARAKQQ